VGPLSPVHAGPAFTRRRHRRRSSWNYWDRPTPKKLVKIVLPLLGYATNAANATVPVACNSDQLL